MKITHIELKNIGLHKALSFDSDAPVIGIIGPNGHGKSTILDAIQIGVTGEATDTLESYVSHGADRGSIKLNFMADQEGSIFRGLGKSSTRELQWDGRSITRSKEVDEIMSEILKADKKSVHSAVFIRQGSLQSILFGGQADKEELFVELVNLSYCQKRVNIIEGKIKKLQTLVADFGSQKETLERQVQEAEVILNQRSNELDALPDQSVAINQCLEMLGLHAEIDRLTVEEHQTKLELQTLQRELEQPRFRACSKDDLAKRCEALLTAWRDGQTKVQSLQKGMADLRVIRDLRARIGEDEAAANKAMAVVAQYNEAKLKDRQRELRSLVSYLREKKRLEDELAIQDQRQTTTSLLLRNLGGAPKGAPTDEDLVHMEDDINDAKWKIKQLTGWLEFREKIQKCVDRSTGLCPECGLQVTDLSQVDESEIARLRDSITQETHALEKKEQDYQKWLKAGSEYTKKRSALETQLSNAQSNVDNLAQQLGNLIKPHTIDGSGMTAEEAETEISNIGRELSLSQASLALYHNHLSSKVRNEAKLKEFTSEPNPKEFNQDKYLAMVATVGGLQNMHKEAQSLLTEISQLDAKREQLETKEVQLRHSLSETDQTLGSFAIEGVDNPSRDSINLGLAGFRGNQEARQQKIGEVNRSKEVVASAKATLAELLVRIEKDRKVSQCIEKLRLLKTVVSDLPVRYVAYKFKQIAEITQAYLSELTSDFAISVDPDRPLNFQFSRCNEDNSFNMPQNKLSGGQRVRLSLAFLLAVHEILVPEVGLLILDEPSLSLDTEGVESLAQFLSELHDKIAHTNMQVIVVDHHPALAACFKKCLIVE